MPIEKFGKTYWPNSEISGVNIEFYHISGDDHEKGTAHTFGVKTVLPENMASAVDWERAQVDSEYAASFASDSLMMHVDAIEKTVAMHPECLEVIDFFGRTHDVSDLGIEKIIGELVKDMDREQYEEEKSKGIIPSDWTFEDWCEVTEAVVSVPDGTKLH